MVRDDLEACTQAYRFAELLLAREPTSEKERAEAISAAETLCQEVEERYQRMKQGAGYAPSAIASLEKLKAKVEERLRTAQR